MYEKCRYCKECGKEIRYSSKRCYITSFKNRPNGVLCKKCVYNNCLGKRDFSGKNNPFYGKKHSKKTIEKLKREDKSYTKTEKFRKTMSAATSGEKNPMYGHTIYEKWVEHYGKSEADLLNIERKNNLSEAFSGNKNPMYGKSPSCNSGKGCSGWYDGYFFRSLRELNFILYMEKNNIEWKTAEKKMYRVEYIYFNGKRRTYVPDFIIEEEKLFVECKPERLFNTPLNILKRNAILKKCQDVGFEYVMLDPGIVDIDILKKLIIDGRIKMLRGEDENKIFDRD